MKLKMAPNSLFAVLLRSPWWISIGIALAFVAAAQALLPEQYRVLGSMGAMPLVGIGLVAMWRQLRAPSTSQVEALRLKVAAMSWAEFSKALEQKFTRDGYVVERLQGAAAEFALQKEGRTTLVSAKRWKAARHGAENVQALHAAAQQRDASRSFYIASGEFSPNAIQFARAHAIELMRPESLAGL